MWDATAFAQAASKFIYFFFFFWDTHTQVEKGKFVQVQSPEDLILLAVKGAV